MFVHAAADTVGRSAHGVRRVTGPRFEIMVQRIRAVRLRETISGKGLGGLEAQPAQLKGWG